MAAIVLTAMLSLGATASRAADPAPADQVVAPVPALRWGPCHDLDLGNPYRCATARVPLDYDDPTGPTAILDLLKVPAREQGRRLGTLFVNPGGPGGSSREFAPMAAQLLGRTVATRFDVVGIDPRGVGPSSRMTCTTDEPAPAYPEQSFPVTERQAAIQWRFSQWQRAACSHNPGRIVHHMSTADTARDMDLIRQAVGDAALNYYGISYGTQLGSTYASLFPSRVGRLVVDGVLDPVAWATGWKRPPVLPFSTRLHSARGASEGLVAALAECDRVGRPACSFAGDAPAKWRRLVAIARAGDLTVGGQEMSYPDLIGLTLANLYGSDYTGLAGFYQTLWRENVARDAQPPAAPVDLEAMRRQAAAIATAPYAPVPRRTSVVGDAFFGVACADSRNPRTREAWWEAGRVEDARYPWFGSLWTWASSGCGGWPGAAKADGYLGPFGGPTANPILVVGNTHDPATPWHGAQQVARLFDSARLVRMDGWGHGALGNTCVTALYDRYYASGALPAHGTVCPADGPLYAGS
ncbi:MAG: alpha/beta hydrolase [Tetrasphaera sp.]